MASPTAIEVDVPKRRHARNSMSAERAQGLVEFALIVPILLILVMGVLDFGWGLRAYITLPNSAREGARLGVTCATDAEIKAQVAAYSGGLVDAAKVTVVKIGR